MEPPDGWAKESARDFLLRLTWGKEVSERKWGEGIGDPLTGSRRFHRGQSYLTRVYMGRTVDPML